MKSKLTKQQKVALTAGVVIGIVGIGYLSIRWMRKRYDKK